MSFLLELNSQNSISCGGHIVVIDKAALESRLCSGKRAENFTNLVYKQSIFKWPKDWPGQNIQNNSSWPLQLGSADQTHYFLQLLKTTARQLEDMTAQAKEFFDVKGSAKVLKALRHKKLLNQFLTLLKVSVNLKAVQMSLTQS